MEVSQTLWINQTDFVFLAFSSRYKISAYFSQNHQIFMINPSRNFQFKQVGSEHDELSKLIDIFPQIVNKEDQAVVRVEVDPALFIPSTSTFEPQYSILFVFRARMHA